MVIDRAVNHSPEVPLTVTDSLPLRVVLINVVIEYFSVHEEKLRFFARNYLMDKHWRYLSYLFRNFFLKKYIYLEKNTEKKISSNRPWIFVQIHIFINTSEELLETTDVTTRTLFCIFCIFLNIMQIFNSFIRFNFLRSCNFYA